jgi:hypothetical protein
MRDIIILQEDSTTEQTGVKNVRKYTNNQQDEAGASQQQASNKCRTRRAQQKAHGETDKQGERTLVIKTA